MKKLYKRIHAFSLKAFPKAKPEHHLLKAKQEIDETINEPDKIDEYADCFIALFAAVARAGFEYIELKAATDKKMTINEAREWQEFPDGTFQYIKK
jgi:hypothetical protein